MTVRSYTFPFKGKRRPQRSSVFRRLRPRPPLLPRLVRCNCGCLRLLSPRLLSRCSTGSLLRRTWSRCGRRNLRGQRLLSAWSRLSRRRRLPRRRLLESRLRCLGSGCGRQARRGDVLLRWRGAAYVFPVRVEGGRHRSHFTRAASTWFLFSNSATRCKFTAVYPCLSL